ncbi:MAG: hypothetical protein AB1488_03115, partial [Nitrospirota bacterium]
MKQSNFKRLLIKISVISIILLIIIASFFLYIRFSEVKRTLLRVVSEKVSHRINQGFIIEDAGYDPLRGAYIKGIKLGNPEGFERGDLLEIGEIRTYPILRDIIKGKLNFKSIVLINPVMNLKKKNGKWNISDNLIELISKGEREYFIKSFKIERGSITVDDNPLL